MNLTREQIVLLLECINVDGQIPPWTAKQLDQLEELKIILERHRDAYLIAQDAQH